MESRERFIFLIGQARNRLFTRLDQRLLSDAGITAVQSGALYYLLENDGCQSVELSRGLMLDKSAITGLIDRLECKGLVERRPSTNDRRSGNVYLTKAGREAAINCLGITKEFNRKIIEGLSEEEAGVFASSLKKVIGTFS
jgi:MarR family transcriptional regulator, organic hydroperoxide resistance regulator